MEEPPTAPAIPARRSTATLALYLVAAVGAVAVLAIRIRLIPGLPLWLDETWTAVIAGQPSWRAFWREVWLDANAPFYYLVMALWPGDGPFALRLPSLLFMIAVPLVAFLWKLPGLSREARLAWAALLFFWAPGLLLSADARSYALLLLVSVAQTVAYARLMEAPGLRRAAWWCGLAALAVLTHYFAAWPALVQGLFYLALHRGRAVRTWPALLALVPLAAWGIHHLPRLLIYAQPDVVWYERLSFSGALTVAAYAVGSGLLFALLLAAVLAACRLLRPEGSGPGARWAALSGLAALALVTAVGMVQPFLVDRYLTPLVPGVLLGIVLLARAPAGYAAVAALYLAWIDPAAIRGTLERRAVFGLDRPTRYLLAARPDSLTYSLGYGGARVMDPATMSQIGGYFFERSGRRVEARMIVTGADALGELLGAARGARPAIILLYRAENRPDLGRLPADWQCLDQPGYRSGTLACAPRRLFVSAPS